MEEKKQKAMINTFVAIVFCIIGIANVVLWYKEILGIYGLVFGAFWIIVAWFIFHFRRKK